MADEEFILDRLSALKDHGLVSVKSIHRQCTILACPS